MPKRESTLKRLAMRERILRRRYHRSHPHFKRNIAVDAVVSCLLVVILFGEINHVSENARLQTLMRSGAVAMTADELVSHVKSASLEAYWFGPISGYKYTIIYVDRKEIIVSYVPQGVSLNAPDRYNLAVETYSKSLTSELPGKSKLATDKDDFLTSSGAVSSIYSDHPQTVKYAVPRTDKYVEVQYPSHTSIFDVYKGEGRLKLISES